MDRPSDPGAWERLRAICGALPDVTSKITHGELAWLAGSGGRARQFATTWDHHHDDPNAVLMAAPPGAQEELAAREPVRYFRPPSFGARGWIGIYLDTAEVDWDLVELHLRDAHALVTDR